AKHRRPAPKKLQHLNFKSQSDARRFGGWGLKFLWSLELGIWSFKVVLAPQLSDKQGMPFANVTIHASQFPEAVRRDLLASLRTRRVNHKFHYDSVKQTQKWLALHQAYAPSRNDRDCAAIYDQAFRTATASIEGKRIHLIGLGCGGGQKDTR